MIWCTQSLPPIFGPTTSPPPSPGGSRVRNVEMAAASSSPSDDPAMVRPITCAGLMPWKVSSPSMSRAALTNAPRDTRSSRSLIRGSTPATKSSTTDAIRSAWSPLLSLNSSRPYARDSDTRAFSGDSSMTTTSGRGRARGAHRVVKARGCRCLPDVDGFAGERLAFGKPLGSDTGDGPGTTLLEILHGSTANRAKSPGSQNAIARPNAQSIDCLATSEAGEGQSRAGLEADAGRKPGEAGGRNDRALCVGALTVEGKVRDDPIADGKPGYARAECYDGAGCIHAEDRGQIERHHLGNEALPHVEVHRIEAGRDNLDQDLSLAGDGVGPVLELELIDITIRLKAGRFHVNLAPVLRASRTMDWYRIATTCPPLRGCRFHHEATLIAHGRRP